MNITDAIPGLKALLDYFQKERHWRDDQKVAALESLYIALSETRIYLKRLEDGRGRKRTSEEELGRLWSRAAAQVSRVDHDLANRCLLKGDAWLRPDHWSEELVQQSRIGIDQVWEDARRLLQS